VNVKRSRTRPSTSARPARTHGHVQKTLSMAAILVVGLVGFAPPASAEVSGPFSGVLLFRGTPGDVPGTGFFSGAFNAICTERASVTQGPGGTFEATDRFDCPQGSVFNRISGTADFQLDPVTCVARVPQSGTFQITGGTGDFAGASGGGTFTGQAYVVFARGPEGCDFAQPPLVDVLVLRLAGSLDAGD
jgi:hypothetical protein